MKVFKFYSRDYFYAYSGKDIEEAKQALFEEIGVIDIYATEEIPESQWDDKIIAIWEDNDFETEPDKVSIREQFVGNDPQMIYTNDYSTF